MLNKNYLQRISANDVLSNEWVVNSSNFNVENEQVALEAVKNLKTFQVSN